MSTIAFAARVAARPRVYTWLVLTGVALWLMGLAWSRPLTLPDEGRYAGVAWEMLRSHSPFVPLMDGMPYFHKPPLYYWLAQISFALFGLTEWAARLPSLLIAWASVAGIYAFTRRYRASASHWASWGCCAPCRFSTVERSSPIWICQWPA